MTPLADVIAALQATEIMLQDAVGLLPSVVDGLEVRASSISVRAVTQESPLRELLLVTLLVAFQDDLKSEIPPMIEDLLGVTVSEGYDSLVTVVFMIVVFYGAAMAKDLVVKAAENTKVRQTLDSLVTDLAVSTGRSEHDIRKALDARFAHPKAMKRVIEAATGWFRPSHREGNAAVTVDRRQIPSDVVRDVPPREAFNQSSDYDRYNAHNAVELELHAKDKDRAGAGWAAVARGISDRRLRMKVMEPVNTFDLWERESVVGDIVVVSKLTAHGYVPTEIHLTAIVSQDEGPLPT